MKNPLTAFPQRLRQRMPNTFRNMAEWENELDRWLQESFSWTGWPEKYEGFDFMPTCNLKETNKEYIIQFDVPGVKKEDVKIEVENNRLTISGERKEKREEKTAKHFFSESYFGSFMRSFNLPSTIDESMINATYEDGVLTIAVPKQQTSKAKEVKIQ